MRQLPELIIGFVMLAFMPQSKAGWTYNNVQRLEGPYSTALLTTVKSDAEATDHYKMETDGSDYITIDEATGKITQIKEFDYETKKQYNIAVTAYDVSNVQTEDTVTFFIDVLDRNDNRPEFVEKSLKGSVEEAHEKGASSEAFMRVSATDADSGDHAKIVYSIKEDVVGTIDSASGTKFLIDRESGDVRLSDSAVLDYETTPELSFTVIAADNNGYDPKYTTETIVVVEVLDSNDHAPVFDPKPQPFSVLETTELDKTILDIFASDTDEGVNKKVYFNIGGGNTGGVFKVLSNPSATEKSSGELQLAKKLDFESGITSYDLEIIAFNKDASNHADQTYATTTTIGITVIDVNEPPIFRNTPYSASVTEGPSGYDGEPIPLVTVFAEDIDFKGNQTVTYSLNDPEGWFAIDTETGLVTLKSVVDREAKGVVNGIYNLRVVATDNYDHGPPASQEEIVEITINDINDNPPAPDWGQDSKEVLVCEEPTSRTVTVISASDPDSSVNGPPFTFRFDDSVNTNQWGFEKNSSTSTNVIAKFSDYGLTSGQEDIILPFTITDSGTIPQTGTATLSIKICKCDSDGNTTCSLTAAGGFPVIIIIIIIAVILLVVIVLFAAVTYKRRQAAMSLKEPLIYDEDDVRETVQVYQEEGGEEDQDAYDLSALRAPLMADPNRPVEKTVPVQSVPRVRNANPPDDIANIIGEAKDQADNDPSAPPFDSLLVFDYEGAGSDAGSLSSINTATTDGSMDYDYLNDWGPRFKRLADMYNDGSESE